MQRSYAVERAIVVTGLARSGTTLVGKLIHSAHNVEYAFEPSTLRVLFACIRQMDKKIWKMLYATYLYEEIGLNGLAGRSINTNTHDDSSIYRSKDPKTVERRLSKSWRRTELASMMRDATLSFKLPNLIEFVPDLLGLFPETRIVYVHRDLLSVVAFTVRKRWFSDESLRAGFLTPNYSVAGTDLRVPFYIPEELSKPFVAADEVSRVVAAWAVTARSAAQVSEAIWVDYARLVEEPNSAIRSLLEQLDLKGTDRTDTIQHSIICRSSGMPFSKDQPIDFGIREHFSFEARTIGQLEIELATRYPAWTGQRI